MERSDGLPGNVEMIQDRADTAEREGDAGARPPRAHLRDQVDAVAAIDRIAERIHTGSGPSGRTWTRDDLHRS